VKKEAMRVAKRGFEHPDRYLPIKDFVHDHFWIVCVENNFRNRLCGGEPSLRVVEMGLLLLKEGS